jgi:hypothetical protein
MEKRDDDRRTWCASSSNFGQGEEEFGGPRVGAQGIVRRRESHWLFQDEK